MKSRLSVYLDPALMRQLAELAELKKKSMSLVAETAIMSLLTPDEADRRPSSGDSIGSPAKSNGWSAISPSPSKQWRSLSAIG